MRALALDAARTTRARARRLVGGAREGGLFEAGEATATRTKPNSETETKPETKTEAVDALR